MNKTPELPKAELRTPQIDELMRGLEYAGFSSSDKDGNWKMVWFKPLLDYVRQLEATRPAVSDEQGLRSALDNWSKPSYIRLHAGEMGAKEVRAVQTVVNALKALTAPSLAAQGER